MSRRTLGRVSNGLLVLFLLFLADAGVQAFLDGRGPLRIVAGNETDIVGDLDKAHDFSLLARNDVGGEAVASPEALAKALACEIYPAGPALRFISLQGRIWRGALSVPAGTPAGSCTIRVFPAEAGPGARAPVIEARIFPDEAALQSRYASLSLRFIGLPPLVLAGVLLLCGVGTLVQAFFLSAREDRRLQARGIGPIYKLSRRRKTGEWEIMFGLGTEHGVRAGDRLLLLDQGGRQVGELVARSVGCEAAEAELGPECSPAPGFLVARPGASTGAVPGAVTGNA